MSALLRHLATVPALFSRALDPEPRHEDAVRAWSRVAQRVPVVVMAAWVAVAVIDVPLVKAAVASVGLALPR